VALHLLIIASGFWADGGHNNYYMKGSSIAERAKLPWTNPFVDHQRKSTGRTTEVIASHLVIISCAMLVVAVA
jgi:hypothetical protein